MPSFYVENTLAAQQAFHKMVPGFVAFGRKHESMKVEVCTICYTYADKRTEALSEILHSSLQGDLTTYSAVGSGGISHFHLIVFVCLAVFTHYISPCDVKVNVDIDFCL